MIAYALLLLNLAAAPKTYENLPEAPAVENPLRREWMRYKLYALLDQAWLNIRAGEPAKALPYIDEAMRQDPDFARTRYTRYIAFRRLKDSRAETEAAWLRAHAPGLALEESDSPPFATARTKVAAASPPQAPVAVASQPQQQQQQQPEARKSKPAKKTRTHRPVSPAAGLVPAKPPVPAAPSSDALASALTTDSAPANSEPANSGPANSGPANSGPAETTPAVAAPATVPDAPVAAPLLADQGFAALAAGDKEKALQLFRASLAGNPGNPVVVKQLAYLEKDAGHPERAAALFRTAQDLAPSDPGRPLLKRETAMLGSRLSGQAWMLYRGGHFDAFGLPFARELAHSSAGGEVDYRLPLQTFDRQEGLRLFVRGYTGFEGNTLNPDGKSVQGAAGFSLRPLRSLNLAVSAERMIKIGDAARADWMVRAAWGTGDGYIPPLGAKSWNYWNIYAEGALIRPSDPDLLGAFEARYGRGFAFGERWLLVPQALFNVTAQRASGQTTTIGEAGAGIGLKYRFNGDAYADYRSSVEFRIEARGKLFGNGREPAALLFSVGASF